MKIRGDNLSQAEFGNRGAIVGENCHIYGLIDSRCESLVIIGNDVTPAGGSRLLTHDGSAKKILGCSKEKRKQMKDGLPKERIRL